MKAFNSAGWNGNLLRVVTLLAACSVHAQSTAQRWDPANNSAGTRLEIKEMSRSNTEQGTVIDYRMTAMGFKKDQIFNLWSWEIGKRPVKVLDGVSTSSIGEVVCAGSSGHCVGDKMNDPIDLKVLAIEG